MDKITERQKEAKRIYNNDILALTLSDCKVGFYIHKVFNKQIDVVFKMCILNGQRWVHIDALNNNWILQMKTKGTVTDSDILHVKATSNFWRNGKKLHRLHLNTIFRLEALIANKDIILNEDSSLWNLKDEGQLQMLFDKGMTVPVDSVYEIGEEAVRKSEEAYIRRRQLISENSNEKRDMVRNRQKHDITLDRLLGECSDESESESETKQLYDIELKYEKGGFELEGCTKFPTEEIINKEARAIEWFGIGKLIGINIKIRKN